MNGGSPTPFALATVTSPAGHPQAVIVREDRATALAPQLGRDASLRELVTDWDAAFPALQALADRLAPDAYELAFDALAPLPPILPPGQIFQAGANYRQHVLDLMAGAEARGDDSDGLGAAARDAARAELEERLNHGRPFVFLGTAHGMVGAHDDVVLPRDCKQPDWELELAAVIGRDARRVAPSDALDHVAGYTICNDVTSRDALNRPDARGMGLDWLAGKGSPTFLPTGPLFVPAAHVADPMNLQIVLRVNGETMQDETTVDMVFGVPALVAFISEVAQLRAGDLVLTGSPAGNGASRGVFLAPGDVMEGTITGLGTQRNHCVAEVPSQTKESAWART
ncbi:MAG TPA: fumarylacetoacetate hydrolase family protein [Solirubrobacteraceae bacterium]|nr:fumarylacetoacetate hydrolase family protein [Solirubrobacteraceae bacterium]